MANIMLTERCNLRCSYCFANDYVCQNGKEMPLDTVKEIISRILMSAPEEKIGIIGGEPTLYSQFGELLDFVYENDLVKHIVVFTNGILLDRYMDRLNNKKLVFLINCNSELEIGKSNFMRLKRNIRTLVEKGFLNNILLGLNVFQINQNIDYYIELLRENQFKYARLSLIVPQDVSSYESAKVYFEKYKSTVMSIFERMAEIGVVPNYDCNRIPADIWSCDEQQHIRELFGNRLEKSNILESCVCCKPTLDIDTNLNVIRCFGFSDDVKIPFTEETDFADLRRFFVENVDEKLIGINICDNNDKLNMEGCLRFKCRK